MLTNKKLDNYNNKYCSCNGIVRSGTCVAKKNCFGNSNGRVRDMYSYKISKDKTWFYFTSR